MATLKSIWTRRRKNLDNKTWNGDDPVPCFALRDLEALKNPGDLQFDEANWNDLSILDFRELVDELIRDEKSEILRKNNFEFYEGGRHGRYFFTADNPVNNFTIVATSLYDQHHVTFYDETEAYMLTWYKNRGRLESFVNIENARPITLAEFTNILESLGLEESDKSEDNY